jgi:hypothetical protein
MNLSDEQKKKLKDLIDGAGFEILEAQDDLKEQMKTLCQEVEEQFGIKPKTFRKFVKVNYLASLEEDKIESDEFYKEFREIMDVE